MNFGQKSVLALNSFQCICPNIVHEGTYPECLSAQILFLEMLIFFSTVKCFIFFFLFCDVNKISTKKKVLGITGKSCLVAWS